MAEIRVGEERKVRLEEMNLLMKRGDKGRVRLTEGSAWM